jgi:hypothetical protein
VKRVDALDENLANLVIGWVGEFGPDRAVAPTVSKNAKQKRHKY